MLSELNISCSQPDLGKFTLQQLHCRFPDSVKKNFSTKPKTLKLYVVTLFFIKFNFYLSLVTKPHRCSGQVTLYDILRADVTELHSL